MRSHRNVRPRARALVVVVWMLLLGLYRGDADVSAGRGPRVLDDVAPNLRIPRVSKGMQAVRDLGVNLPTVARAYGLDTYALRTRLLVDDALAVDRRGRLHFTCRSAAASGAGPVPDAAPILDAGPLDTVFQLHSKPGAPKVIYLDFNGETLTGTAWNVYSTNIPPVLVAPPWDIDGNPLVFGNEERQTILSVWKRVAEDYAVFDVDVTTEDPGPEAIARLNSGDFFFGTRVLVSPIASYFGNYGGLGYIGIFDMTTEYYKPALVFPEMLLNGEKYIAEACSHEAGHNLGLFHDGTTTGLSYYPGHGSGETGWAPIMGNSYGQNVTQWSKGEYPNANNTQQDYSVMSAFGLLVRLDDHGSALGSATILPEGSTLSASGIVEQDADIDYFRFTSGTGPFSILVSPAALGPNLDIVAKLYNSAGVPIATNSPAGQLAAGFNGSLGAGTYYLSVEGGGDGNPPANGYSKYASRGQYTVAGTVTPPAGANQSPVASFTANPQNGIAPLVVNFNATGSTDPDGNIVSYAWTFGDGGTATGPTPSHTFQNPGLYSVLLTVTDNQNAIGTTTRNIGATPPPEPPEAVIVANPTTGFAPLTVNFSGGLSSDLDGSIVSYSWSFGDATTGSGPFVAHTYSTPGTYTASLTVTDTQNLTDTVTSNIVVNASNLPPIPAIASSLQSGPAPSTVTLSASASNDPDGSIVAYEWNFGDGTGGNGIAATHTFSAVGTYVVTLTVRDNNGATASTTSTLSILPDTAFILRVAEIQSSTQDLGGGQHTVTSVARITNLLGLPISGIEVTARFSGLTAKTRTGTTDASGQVTLVSPAFTGAGTVSLRITGAVSANPLLRYDSTRNVVTASTVTVP